MLDLVRERKPPFAPSETTAEFCNELKRYGVGCVVGDRYAAEWVSEQFRLQNIAYRTADKSKSDIYDELIPLINSGGAELLDHQKLLAQLGNLERRTARGGRSSIDHPPGGRDDVANAVAGVIVHVSKRSGPEFFFDSLDPRPPLNADGTTLAFGLPGEVPPGIQDALAWRRAQARGEVRP